MTTPHHSIGRTHPVASPHALLGIMDSRLSLIREIAVDIQHAAIDAEVGAVAIIAAVDRAWCRTNKPGHVCVDDNSLPATCPAKRTPSARCVRLRHTVGLHRDIFGNEWE